MLDLIATIGIWLIVLELVDINSKLFNIQSRAYGIWNSLERIKKALEEKRDEW